MIRVHEKSKKKQLPMLIAGVTFLGLIVFIAWLLIAFTGFIQVREQLKKDTQSLQLSIIQQNGLLERILDESMAYPVKDPDSQNGLRKVVKSVSASLETKTLFIDSGAVAGLTRTLVVSERESERFFSLHALQGDEVLDRKITVQQDSLRGCFMETRETLVSYNASVKQYNEVINRFPLALLKYFLSYQERIPFPIAL